MLKVVTVIGARPQFIKAAAISRAIKNFYSDRITEIIVHTGQHYDPEMSEIFFEQLNIPSEQYNLKVGSGSHGVQTAKIIIALEEVLIKEKPGAIILFGDTNSTLAGAVVASKLEIPIIHIEAGMRSFTKKVPEEINRIMCDHVSTLLFSPTHTGINNLYKEGFSNNNSGPYNVDNPKVIFCGDIMYDNSLFFRSVALKESQILKSLNVDHGKFCLVTIHRNNNTDHPGRLADILMAINQLSLIKDVKFIIPLHPRTNKILESDQELKSKITSNKKIILIPPASYLDMIALESACEMVITDSGGVQKEAYYFEKPCIILQNETPWIELVENGCALLADADQERIISAFNYFRENAVKLNFKPVFGDGKAAEFTVEEILRYIGS